MTKEKQTYNIDDLIEKVKTYITNEEDLELIRKVYIYSKEKHLGQTRVSGEEYINHPVATAMILTSVFAFLSLTNCSFYGEKSVEYLLGNKYIKVYKLLYVILAFVGCVNPPKIVWAFADICNGLMAVPNLFALNCLDKKIDYP